MSPLAEVVDLEAECREAFHRLCRERAAAWRHAEKARKVAAIDAVLDDVLALRVMAADLEVTA